MVSGTLWLSLLSSLSSPLQVHSSLALTLFSSVRCFLLPFLPQLNTCLILFIFSLSSLYFPLDLLALAVLCLPLPTLGHMLYFHFHFHFFTFLILFSEFSELIFWLQIILVIQISSLSLSLSDWKGVKSSLHSAAVT